MTVASEFESSVELEQGDNRWGEVLSKFAGLFMHWSAAYACGRTNKLRNGKFTVRVDFVEGTHIVKRKVTTIEIVENV